MLELTSKEQMAEGLQGKPLASDVNRDARRKYYIESYGCAMNFNDSEIVASLLHQKGFGSVSEPELADLILVNTCSIREKAEQTVRNRLVHFKRFKKNKPALLVGILGCMAERLKDKLLEEEKLVDIVIGPDAYRTLPDLIEEAETGQKAVNVLLSREETYADISPIRLDQNGVSSFVSIMRGCNNMCSFCVVPFTRGRERSRDAYSVVAEARQLFEDGYREVTLLGQNVDSYRWENPETSEAVSFAHLLEMVANINPLLRVRFSTSHPKDITDDVLHAMSRHANICKYIHLPLQSGSTRILQRMNRTYTKEWYMHKIDRIRQILPGCAISTDIITGFCSETDEDHQETLEVMEYARYELAYTFEYSERPGTLAARRYPDDVPLEVKNKRLLEIINLHRKHSLEKNQEELGKRHLVLVEGPSKKNPLEWCGRTDTNKMVVFPKLSAEKCQYVQVEITEITSGTLKGRIIG